MAQHRQNAQPAPHSPRYPHGGTVRLVSDSPLPAGPAVQQGSTLATRKGLQITLGQILGRGGEGAVFETDRPDLVAKIYADHRLTRGRIDKLERMVASGLDHGRPESASICWPRGLLLDRKKIVRGYVMPRGGGVPLATSVLIPSELQSRFPHWNRAQLVELCRTVLRPIALLHDEGVILGDINGNNLLVLDEKRVFLVDCDSYQLAGYPCPVGTEEFTPPELLGQSFGQVLRTTENECFSVAILLFTILFAGKQPYAQTGSDTPQQAVRDMAFPYPFGNRKSWNVPMGGWRFIWSHLPHQLKRAFFETFDASCKSLPRRPVSEWIRLLDSYAFALSKGHLCAELFPKERKAVSDHARKQFGVVVPPEQGRRLRCTCCNNEFWFSLLKEQEFASRGWQPPKRCEGCNKLRKLTASARSLGPTRVPMQHIPPPCPTPPVLAPPMAPPPLVKPSPPRVTRTRKSLWSRVCGVFRA